MRNLFVLLAFGTALVSCTAMNGTRIPHTMDEPGTDEQMRAEYHLMRNNLNLAIRENEVVKEENRICRSEIRQFKKEIRGLQTEQQRLNQLYEKDMARMQEEYRILEDQSTARIQELTETSAKLSDRLANEREQFNAALKIQKADFRKERTALKKDFSRQLQEQEDRLKQVETERDEKEADNASLNTSLSQAGNQIDNLTKTLAACQERVSDLERKDTVPDGKDSLEYEASPPPVAEQ